MASGGKKRGSSLKVYKFMSPSLQTSHKRTLHETCKDISVTAELKKNKEKKDRVFNLQRILSQSEESEESKLLEHLAHFPWQENRLSLKAPFSTPQSVALKLVWCPRTKTDNLRQSSLVLAHEGQKSSHTFLFLTSWNASSGEGIKWKQVDQLTSWKCRCSGSQ